MIGDRRSLALHRAIAEKLREDPALIAIALDVIERWSRAGGRSQPYWDAWREILKRPLPQILDLLGEESERMTALRQATPFAGVLEPAERWAIYEKFNLERAASAIGTCDPVSSACGPKAAVLMHNLDRLNPMKPISVTQFILRNRLKTTAKQGGSLRSPENLVLLLCRAKISTQSGSAPRTRRKVFCRERPGSLTISTAAGRSRRLR